MARPFNADIMVNQDHGMQIYDQPDIKKLLMALVDAESVLDAISVYRKYGFNSENLQVILSLDYYSPNQSLRKLESIASIENVIPYYRSHQLLLLNSHTVSAAQRGQSIDISVDHTLMFDSNVASSISTMFRGRSLGSNHNQVIKLMDAVIHNNYNFDHLFYMQESIKLVRVTSEKWTGNAAGFWKKLRKGFRWNLAALMCFRKIDCSEYINHSRILFSISFREAVREAQNAAYSYYVSDAGKISARNVILMQRELLLLLLIALRVKFSTPPNVKNQTKLLLVEVHKTLGVFHEREVSILVSFFNNPKSVPILETVNRGGKNRRLLKKVDNIAWDFYTPRAMERVINQFSDGQIILPYLATFDKNLKVLANMFPIKGTILSMTDGLHLPFRSNNQFNYFEEHGVSDIVAGYFTDQKIQERALNRALTIEDQFIKIKSEYKKLRSLMQTKPAEQNLDGID